MDHLLILLGLPSSWRQVFAGAVSPGGLALLVVLETALIWRFTAASRRLSPELDRLSAAGLGATLGHATLLVLLNLGVHLLGSAFWAGVIAWPTALLLAEVIRGTDEVPQARLPEAGPLTWTTAGVMLLMAAWLLALACGIDFGKFHFPLATNIQHLGALPGTETFSLCRGGYHYGANLFAASIQACFGMKPWVAEDMLPFVLSWTPFAGLRWLSLRFFQKDREASLVALLACLGANIRLYLIAGLAGIYLFSGGFSFAPELQDTIRLASRDFDLNPSTALSHIEQLLLPGSQLGWPILLAVLGLWVAPHARIGAGLILATVLLCAAQALCREDYLAFTAIGLLVLLWRTGALFTPRILLPLAALALLIVVQGGLLSATIKARVIPDAGNFVVIGQSQSQESLSPSLSPVPVVGTLSIENAHRKVPLWHPQVLLDLVGDYSILILGVMCVPAVVRRAGRPFNLVFWFPLAIFLAFWLFVDHPGIPYKLDLQRVLSYNLLTWLFATALFLRFPGWLRARVVLPLVLTGCLALIAMPARCRGDWNWYDRDCERAGAWLAAQPDSRAGEILGINPGWVGLQTWVYPFEKNLHPQVEQVEAFRRLHRDGDPAALTTAGVRYVVYRADEVPAGLLALPRTTFGTMACIQVR